MKCNVGDQSTLSKVKSSLYVLSSVKNSLLSELKLIEVCKHLNAAQNHSKQLILQNLFNLSLVFDSLVQIREFYESKCMAEHEKLMKQERFFYEERKQYEIIDKNTKSQNLLAKQMDDKESSMISFSLKQINKEDMEQQISIQSQEDIIQKWNKSQECDILNKQQNFIQENHPQKEISSDRNNVTQAFQDDNLESNLGGIRKNHQISRFKIISKQQYDLNKRIKHLKIINPKNNLENKFLNFERNNNKFTDLKKEKTELVNSQLHQVKQTPRPVTECNSNFYNTLNNLTQFSITTDSKHVQRETNSLSQNFSLNNDIIIEYSKSIKPSTFKSQHQIQDVENNSINFQGFKGKFQQKEDNLNRCINNIQKSLDVVTDSKNLKERQFTTATDFPNNQKMTVLDNKSNQILISRNETNENKQTNELKQINEIRQINEVKQTNEIQQTNQKKQRDEKQTNENKQRNERKQNDLLVLKGGHQDGDDEDEDIQNISYEEKLFKLNQEFEDKELREFQEQKRQQILSKQSKIREKIKSFQKQRQEIDLDYSQEDISDSLGEYYHNSSEKYQNAYFKVLSIFCKKVHSTTINELIFLDSSQHLSISCNKETFTFQIPTKSLTFQEVQSAASAQVQSSDQEINLQKIDLGQESISQVKYIPSLSLLICVNQLNSILVFRYSSQDQQSILIQIINHCHIYSIETWLFLQAHAILVTDGQKELKFWNINNTQDTDTKSIVNDNNDNDEEEQNKCLHRIKHEMFGTSLCYFENKEILYQAGNKTINGYTIDVEKKDGYIQAIHDQLIFTLDCQKQGVIQSIQMIEFNPYKHLLMSVHEKGKAVLWNIFNKSEYLSYQQEEQKTISQIYYSSFVDCFIAFLDDQFSSDIIFLDSYLNLIHMPFSHNHIIQLDKKINQFQLSFSQNLLSIGYENGTIQILQLIKANKQ